jgi:hypothetical protein
MAMFRIRRIRMFLVLLGLDPDPSLFCTDPNPCINKQKNLISAV